MDDATKGIVRSRAQYQCEYCGIPQKYFAELFHIEHIIPRQHRGSDDVSNLAYACRRCNLHKGPNIAGLDPETDKLTQLYSPRTDDWNEHFVQDERSEIVGLTDIGRATVYVLAMNAERRVLLRMAITKLEGKPSQ